ncbi:hypothetical protein MC885_008374 [Smutsia gigantea]|nr:hypothetical protein MC885_008374 [Smutsia gigantea]
MEETELSVEHIYYAELGIRHVLLTIKCLQIHPNRVRPQRGGSPSAPGGLRGVCGARPPAHRDPRGGGGAGAGRQRGGERGGAGPDTRALGSADAAASTDPGAPEGPEGAEGPMAKKPAGERDKKLPAKEKTDKKRALRRL